MLTVFMTRGSVKNFAMARRCDTGRFSRFFHAMLDQGVYLPPSQFECWFLSAAHTPEDVDRTIAAAKAVVAEAQH
jgi:glutamate-1-semialdehyde 2,1-aminomutase